MKIHFLLLSLLFPVGLSAQINIHSTELPLMTRSAIHNVLVGTSGEKLYYFTSRTCSATKFFVEDQFGVQEIGPGEHILAISGVVDPLDNIWILSDFDGLQLKKLTLNGDVLESWRLPLNVSPFSPDPILIWTDRLELLLDGQIYRLDPYNQLLELVDTPIPFKNIIYNHAVNQLIAYNDTLLCFIDEFNNVVFEAEFPSIQHVFIGPYDEVYQVGRWSIQAVSLDEGIKRLINFPEPLSNGMVTKVGDRFLLFESPSSLFWESYRTLDMDYGKLEEKVCLTELGYLVTYPVATATSAEMFLLGYDQYAYRVLTIGEDSEEETFPDILIQHASGQIQDWSSDKDGYQIEVKVTMEMVNVGDYTIDYFTIACSTGTSTCQEWYYFTDSIPDFEGQAQVAYSFDLHLHIDDLGPGQDSIYLAELWVLAVNGLPDKNRSDNHISTYAHFVATTATHDAAFPFEAVIYPNPCTDVIFINSDKLLPFRSLSLYDGKGKKVKSLSDQNIPNSISSLPTGSYFLLGEMEDGRRTKPALVIKQ